LRGFPVSIDVKKNIHKSVEATAGILVTTQHTFLKEMLAEIDKDARDIAALQHENKILTSQVLGLERKVSELDQVTKEFESVKSEMLQMQKYIRRLKSFDETPILLNAETMEEVVLKPFIEIKGRRLYHAPVDEDGQTRYIAGRNISLIRVLGRGEYYPPNTIFNTDHHHINCCRRKQGHSLAHGFVYYTCHDIAIEAYFKQKYADTFDGRLEIRKYKCTTSTPVNYCSLEEGFLGGWSFHPTTATQQDSKDIYNFSLWLIEIV
jgi:cell division protein FtsB